MSLFSRENKCPICKKVFLAGDPWGYTRNDKKYCSYTCLRAHDKKARIQTEQRRLKPRERAELTALIMDGVDHNDIAAMMGITPQAVAYHQKKIIAKGANHV